MATGTLSMSHTLGGEKLGWGPADGIDMSAVKGMNFLLDIHSY